MINGRALIHNLVPLIKLIRRKCRRNSRTFEKYASFILIAVTVMVFGATISFDFVSWDDPQLITNNSAIQNFSLDTLKTIFTSYDPELYIPFTLLSYQIEHAFFGLRPVVFHSTNVLLHILNVLLVFWVTLLFFKKKNVAFATAILFAVHPIQVEAVSWVSARKDLLSAFFFLASLGFYLRRTPQLYLASIALFVAALLSKISIALLPFVLLLVDWKEGQQNFKRLVPYCVLSTIFIIVALYGKDANIEALSVLDRSLLAAKSTFFYLWKILLPQNLSLFYPESLPISFIPACFLVLCAALCFFVRHKFPSLIASCIFYIIMLIPSFASFSRRGELYLASDRYVYLASIGIFFMCAVLLFRFQKRIPYIMLSICVFVLGFLSIERSMVWANSTALYESVLRTNPDSHVAYGNLGLLSMEEGKLDEAIDFYEKAISLNPSFDHPHMNLGIALARQKKYPEALDALRTAVSINPDIPHLYSNLGVVYELSGDKQEAIDAFHNALLRKESIEVHQSLSRLYGEQDQTRKALHHLLRSLQLDPTKQKEAEELEMKIRNAT